MSKECRANRSCNTQGCGRKLHRLLHSNSLVPVAEEAAIVTNHHAVGFHLHDTPQPSTDRSQVALAIVPVTVHYGKNTVQICAFLDNGSDCTLIDESIFTKLGMQGSQRQIKLRTLNRETTFESAALHFDVASIVSKTTIHIEQALSVKTLPKLRTFRPNAQQLMSWPHLRGISFGPCSSSNIGVLVGCYVPEAHYFIDQRKRKKHEPYVIKTVLRWMLADPVGSPDGGELHRHRYVTR
ncbi:hypothetical protein PHET_03615 [Paragonimus heterotremus]|uniref:Peptidase A2 domain-containing protein n=1 Tax=Paragonimus heterotremus TaxID=100268 RepID=A0A8J4T2F6_9TREM|nr:hypothetical protein PHET_03615 [Paragonimus heterotremus]